MTFPENLEQAGEADLVGMEDDSDHLRVAGHTCRRRNKDERTGSRSHLDRSGHFLLDLLR